MHVAHRRAGLVATPHTNSTQKTIFPAEIGPTPLEIGSMPEKF